MELGDFAPTSIVATTPHSRMYVAHRADVGKVAIKELLFAHAPSVEQLDAFEREAELLKKLDHPAIPKFLGHFRSGEGVNLRMHTVQSFIEGRSLAQVIDKGPLPQAQVKDVARQLLEVLEYLHGRVPPVVHRDVKPANVILRDDGKAVLVDFGVARELARGVTHGATMVGTFGYSPLEQLGGTAGPTADLYAVGATLLHALTGLSPADRLTKTMELDLEHPAITPVWQHFLARLVARNPADRFADAREALDALSRWQPPRTWKQRARPLVAGALVLLLGAGGVGVARRVFMGPEQPPDQAFAQLQRTQVPSEQHALLMQLRYGQGRTPAVTALSEAQDSALAGLISGGYPLVRREAALLLGQAPSEGTQALDAALARLGQPDVELSEARALVLGATHQLATKPERFTAERQAMVEKALFGEGSVELRGAVASALTELHPLPPRLLERVLQGATRDGEPLANVLAAVVIGHVSDVPITEDAARRMAAASAETERQLGLILWAKRFPSPDATAALRRAAESDPSATVRQDAQRLLREL